MDTTQLVRAIGESGMCARAVPFCSDGLVTARGLGARLVRRIGYGSLLRLDVAADVQETEESQISNRAVSSPQDRDRPFGTTALTEHAHVIWSADVSRA
jgi:hypothetical protein